MTSLVEQTRKALAFDIDKYDHKGVCSSIAESIFVPEGAKQENERLTPIHSALLKCVEASTKGRIKIDPDVDETGCECVVCGNSVNLTNGGDWENGVDACWECKAHAYDELVQHLDKALQDLREVVKGE